MKRFIPFMQSDPLVAVIRLQGAIMNSGRGLDNPSLAPVIEKAFSRGKPAAVALEINCPGGSPVQSSLIASRIRRLADEKKVPVFAFVEDVAASGGYWLACAADEIFIDSCSITGSIGVISAGFGVHEAIEKVGVQRRVHTAGKSKSLLDPFRPEKPADVKKLKGWLEDLHATFIEYVKSRRGLKLSDNPELFTGEVFIGQKGIDAGLADGIGHLAPVMKERFGEKVKFRRYDQKKPLLARFGARFVDDTLAGLEERAAFARFGL
ncbi:S49 family peptidase [Cognatiyoonia sp. IB215182]|uniref:S49 family peptidase n=1 Tax=Cognatiyoonia sp. IB215182 TaxID=3097353 RepID=UPI002A182A89|nr:S49 family peptidase [Cognatiyoonia sp. IB215182]MDX8352673.1 S49 family peptidase [Cognatiyoonia sp. IB215182]